jgi:hypothetical protein
MVMKSLSNLFYFNHLTYSYENKKIKPQVTL